MMQAESGLMSLCGEPDGAPTRIGAPSMIDHTTGLTAMVGLLSALLRARATGEGCDVDTCLFDVALHQLGYAAIWYLNEGHSPARQPRSAHFSVAPVQTFPTADGWIFVMCLTPKFWSALLSILGRPELDADPRFATPEARQAHRGPLTEVLDAAFRTATTAQWMRTIAGRLPAAPVYELAEALENPFLQANGMIRNVPHPERPDFRVLANPIRINGERLDQRVCSAMGADTDGVVGGAGR
jgi:crotonobetainyl-CoA:carnitine CoA-transferase CaiB-like acyl-CoA transferase